MDDAEAIARIRVESWQDAYAHILPFHVLARLDAQVDLERIRGRIERGGVFVAEIDDVVVGYATIAPPEVESIDTQFQLFSLYFVPTAYGTGAAYALVAHVAAAILDKGEERLSVWVFRDNLRARRFYDKLGAEYVCEDFYAIDGVRYPDIGLIWRDLRKLIQLASRELGRLSGEDAQTAFVRTKDRIVPFHDERF